MDSLSTDKIRLIAEIESLEASAEELGSFAEKAILAGRESIANLRQQGKSVLEDNQLSPAADLDAQIADCRRLVARAGWLSIHLNAKMASLAISKTRLRMTLEQSRKTVQAVWQTCEPGG